MIDARETRQRILEGWRAESASQIHSRESLTVEPVVIRVIDAVVHAVNGSIRRRRLYIRVDSWWHGSWDIVLHTVLRRDLRVIGHLERRYGHRLRAAVLNLRWNRGDGFAFNTSGRLFMRSVIFEWRSGEYGASTTGTEIRREYTALEREGGVHDRSSALGEVRD